MEYYFNNNEDQNEIMLELTYYIQDISTDELINNKIINLRIINFDNIKIYTKHYTDDLLFEEIYKYDYIKNNNIVLFLLDINYLHFHHFIQLDTDINREILIYTYKINLIIYYLTLNYFFMIKELSCLQMLKC